jgi:hypothetical protein
MGTSRYAMLFAALCLLSACDTGNAAPESPKAAAPSPDEAPGTAPAASVDMNSAPQPVATPAAADDKKALTRRCGDAEMTLQCAASDATCTHTSLTIGNADGAPRAVAKPSGLEEYTAVGLGCVAAKNNTAYFVVQYGERPYGCGFCEWYHLYDVRGNLLTHSDPAILTDDTLPDGQNQVPNNREYDELSKKLGIGKPNVEFLDE